MYPTKETQIHLYGGSNPIYRLHRRPLDIEKLEQDYSQADLAVITINNDAGGISSVRYQAFGTSAPSPITNVESYHYISNCSRNIRQDNYYFGFTKAGLKTQRSLNKVLTFLGGRSNTSDGRSRMTVGESVIVERLEIEGKKEGEVMVNFTQYCEARCMTRSLSLKSPPPSLLQRNLDDIQFFSLRSSSLKAKDKIKDFSSVNILSGICLFSQEHLGYSHGDLGSFPENLEKVSIEHSDHLTPLPFDYRPTLYEIESLIRLPNAIADIVSTISATLNVTITLDIPRAQYYASFLDLYAGGRCSQEHINSWLEVIDRRHDQLAEVFIKAVKDALQRRGVYRKSVLVELSSGLEGIVPDIREAIDQGSAPAVEDLLQKILEFDPLFREYYEYLPESQCPLHSLVKLCFTSYSYQILRPVLRRVQEQKLSALDSQRGKPPHRQLLIHVDNPAEWRIYSQAEKILKQYQKKHSSMINPLLLGMFPSELIFTAENTGRTSLYLRKIGQYIYDECARRVVSPSDILERVYGRDVTMRVMDWMRQEGMFNVSAIPGGSSSSRDNGIGTPPGEPGSTEW